MGAEAAGGAREAAEQFVAIALVQPVFKQLRESNQAAEPFKPNGAEKAFRGMLDEELAKRMVERSRWPLVDRIARQLESRGGTLPREVVG